MLQRFAFRQWSRFSSAEGTGTLRGGAFLCKQSFGFAAHLRRQNFATGTPSGSGRGGARRSSRPTATTKGAAGHSALWLAAAPLLRGEAQLAEAGSVEQHRSPTNNFTSHRWNPRVTEAQTTVTNLPGGYGGELAPGRYGSGQLLRSGVNRRRLGHRQAQRMGKRRRNLWLRERRRRPYRSGGRSFFQRRRIKPLQLTTDPEEAYRRRGTLQQKKLNRLLNLGRGVRKGKLPNVSGRALHRTGLQLREHPTLLTLRERRRYYRRPRSKLLWVARRFGRLALRRQHHRRRRRLPRLLGQRLLRMVEPLPLRALQQRWQHHRLETGGLGLANPLPLEGSLALLLGLLRLQPRSRHRLPRQSAKARKAKVRRALLRRSLSLWTARRRARGQLQRRFRRLRRSLRRCSRRLGPLGRPRALRRRTGAAAAAGIQPLQQQKQKQKQLHQRPRRLKRNLWLLESLFWSLGRWRPHRRPQRAYDFRQRLRWRGQLLLRRRRRHSHRRSWVRQRRPWRRSPLQRLLKKLGGTRKLGCQRHQGGKYTRRRLRFGKNIFRKPTLNTALRPRLTLALALASMNSAAPCHYHRPSSGQRRSPLPKRSVSDRHRSKGFLRKEAEPLTQRLALLAETWRVETGAAAQPENCLEDSVPEPLYSNHLEPFNPAAAKVGDGLLAVQSSFAAALRRRGQVLRTALPSTVTDEPVAVEGSASGPLLTTLERQFSPLGRRLRQRRQDRSKKLSVHYVPSALAGEDHYKFSWLREAQATEPEQPQLWHRQRRPAQLRDYTLRRDEALWWSEQLQERQKLQSSNQGLVADWAQRAQQPMVPEAAASLLRRRLPYALLGGLLALEGQLASLLPKLGRRLRRWSVLLNLRSLGLLAGSGPLAQSLRRSDWGPRPLATAGPVYRSSWRHEEDLDWLEQENRYPLGSPLEEQTPSLLRLRPEGRGPGGFAYAARHHLRRLLRRRSLRLILSPRRNNLYMVLQPDDFSGRSGEIVFQRTAGQHSRFKGRSRRDRQNRQNLYNLAAFRLLRFSKENQRYRFLRVVLKGFHFTLTRRQRSGYQRRRYLRSLLWPFTTRQLARRYPLVGLTLQGYNYQPKRPTRRSKKHPRPPKVKSY